MFNVLRCALCILILSGVVLDAPVPRAATAAPSQPITDWSAPHVPGQLIVGLGDDGQVARQRLTTRGVQPLHFLPQLKLAVVEVAEPTGASASAGALAARAADLIAEGVVTWAEPNYLFALAAPPASQHQISTLTFIPNDPFYNSPQAAYLRRLGMEEAWELTQGRPEVIIAILDTGVDLGHEDLRKAIWTNAGEVPGNGLDDDGNGFIDDVHGWDFADGDNDPSDDHGHGTHVAGIAAARINNNLGIAGIAGLTTIMPVDVFPRTGYGTYADLIRAIIYATENGAHVINMSLGATSYSRGEEMAVDYAWSHGVVVVAAAGNTGRNSYHYPAAHPNVIAVAATDSNDNLAGFSTRGDFVDVAAPGVSIYSTYRGNRYGTMSGTSMATPHVAGLAALILARNSTLNPDQVRELIQTTAEDLGPRGWDNGYGHGRINVRRALEATPPNAQPPTSQPLPPLSEWPAGCQDVLVNGNFENGLSGWEALGAFTADGSRVYGGALAAHFVGGPSAQGSLAQTFKLPAMPYEATLWFAYRIENQDYGWGTTPQMPFDDWLIAELRATDGRLLQVLLRTGNSADTATAGLPWDRYLYRMQLADLGELKNGGEARLVFTAFNDGDNLPSDFWLDEIRFCVKSGQRHYLPVFYTGGWPR